MTSLDWLAVCVRQTRGERALSDACREESADLLAVNNRALQKRVQDLERKIAKQDWVLRQRSGTTCRRRQRFVIAVSRHRTAPFLVTNTGGQDSSHSGFCIKGLGHFACAGGGMLNSEGITQALRELRGTRTSSRRRRRSYVAWRRGSQKPERSFVLSTATRLVTSHQRQTSQPILLFLSVCFRSPHTHGRGHMKLASMDSAGLLWLLRRLDEGWQAVATAAASTRRTAQSGASNSLQETDGAAVGRSSRRNNTHGEAFQDEL